MGNLFTKLQVEAEKQQQLVKQQTPPSEPPAVNAANEAEAPVTPIPIYTSERSSERKTVRKAGKAKERAEFRSAPLPTKRRSGRYSFEFYDDQIIKLKQLKHEAEMRGEKISLSDIAREALDEYLSER